MLGRDGRVLPRRGALSRVADPANDVEKIAHGPSWKKPNWPQPARSDLVSALDGDWSLRARKADRLATSALSLDGVALVFIDAQRFV